VSTPDIPKRMTIHPDPKLYALLKEITEAAQEAPEAFPGSRGSVSLSAIIRDALWAGLPAVKAKITRARLRGG